jgi:hypothetical protein
MLESLTRESFAAHLGSVFRAQAPDRVLEFRLVEVKALSTAAGEARQRQPFSLYFLGPGDVLVPQQTVALEHAALGRLGIFLVPVGREPEGYRYEAVFG